MGTVLGDFILAFQFFKEGYVTVRVLEDVFIRMARSIKGFDLVYNIDNQF